MVYTISISVWITSIDAYIVIVPAIGGEQKDGTLIRVLNNMVSKLEKLQEAKMQNAKSNGI
jgi:acid phosphatase family membrane protein YuiD